MRGRPPASCDLSPKEQDMTVTGWIVRMSIAAALIAGSAFGGGWKWEHFPH